MWENLWEQVGQTVRKALESTPGTARLIALMTAGTVLGLVLAHFQWH